MDFKELATKRFSARRYTAEPVSKADIDYMMECARLAPSAHNYQPWKFLLITSDEGKAKVRQCYDRPWFQQAQVYVLAMKNTSECWVRPDDHKAHGDIDLGIAIEHLVLAAADRGLGTCWVANYDVEAVKRLFPREGYEAVAIIPVGHVAPDCPCPKKVRKDLSEIVEEV
ncbi:MAG TPA: nitroreductase [Prevotella sp.]|nr:nitroreductase [Prevotella sp.]